MVDSTPSDEHAGPTEAAVEPSESHAPDEKAGADPQALLLAVGELRAGVEEVRGLVSSQVRSDGQSRVAFEKLHREMLDYKEDFLQRAQEPMYRSLIQLVDDISKIQEQSGEAKPDDLEFIKDQVLEILSRQGVEPFRCEAEFYDPNLQKAVTTEATSDEKAHRRILRSIRPGYRTESRTIRPENVSISVYRKPAEEPANA